MKRNLVLLSATLLILFSSSAMSLTNFWYNGFAVNNVGQVLPATTINVRITITNGSSTQYQETHAGITTDQFGCFMVEVGAGTVITPGLGAISVNAETKILAEAQVGTGAFVVSSNASLSLVLMNSTVIPGNITLPQHNLIIGDALGDGEALPVGGDMTGTNDGESANLQIIPSAVGTNELADDAVTLGKIAHTTNYQFLIAYSGVPSWSGLLRNNSLAGDGISSALGFNLANSNSWTGLQTFSDIEINDMTVSGTNNLMLKGDAAGGDLTGTYPNPLIAANAVGSNEIIDGSVLSAEIANNTIINLDINTNAGIDVRKLEAGSHREVLANNNGTNVWMQLPAAFVVNTPNTPDGHISAVTVQDAINQLDAIKQNAHPTLLQLIQNLWSGGTSISTLGTITSGLWRGSEVEDTYVKNDLTVAGGHVDGTPIGATTKSTGAFTTLESEGDTKLGSDNTKKVDIKGKIISDMIPDNAIAESEIGKSTDAERWKKAYFKQTGGLNIGTNANNVEIQYTANSHMKITKPILIPNSLVSLIGNATYVGTPEQGLVLYVYNTSGTAYTFQGINVPTGQMKVFVYTGAGWVATN